ncbi:hypothetical protein ABBQ38_006143 [Trebouxia sp. C0009 RCD-2024]
MQSQVPALEQQLQAVEAELLQKTQQLDAASAQIAELAEQVQGLTKAMEEKCSLAIREAELKDAHVGEMIILKEKLIKSQQENTEARVQLEADVTPRMIKRLHQIIAKNEAQLHMLTQDLDDAKVLQEAKDTKIAHLMTELACKLEGDTCKASAEVVLTKAGTAAVDTIRGITKKTAQAEVRSQAGQMPPLKQKSAKHEATTVGAPKEVPVTQVQEEPHSGAVIAASPAAASGKRGSSQAPEPTTLNLSAGRNRGQQQCQGNVHLSQEAKGARIAHLMAELACKLEGDTCKASAEVVLTKAGMAAVDTLRGITKKTAQAEVRSQAGQMPPLKQKSAKHEATTVGGPKEVPVTRVQEEPHSGALTTASPAAAPGTRGSSQANQPMTVKPPAGHNRAQQQQQGNRTEGPPGQWDTLWVFKTNGCYRGPILKIHLMGLHVRRALAPHTQVLQYINPTKGPRQAWSLRECSLAWYPSGFPQEHKRYVHMHGSSRAEYGMVIEAFKKRIGNYLVGRTIGEGTYAKVKYGKHCETGEHVAIKILDKESLVSSGMATKIKQEIRILKQLRHPNVVELKEVLASRQHIFMVMELVPGGELFDKIVAEGPMSEAAGRRVLQQLLDGLDHCHQQGIYHRDLKPENVLLASNGDVKLSDFGLGYLRTTSLHSDVLQTTCGTPNYVAPEVLMRSGYQGAPADVWSLGVLLYVIMAGNLPFDEPNLPVLFKKIARAEYSIPAWFTPEMTSLLKAMLNPSVKKRATIAEIRQHKWVARDYEPCMSLQRISSTEVSEHIFEEANVQPQYISQEQQRAQSTDLDNSRQMNAFELINVALDISAIFEAREDVVTRHTRFTSKASVPVLMEAIRSAASTLAATSQQRGPTKLRLSANGGKVNEVRVGVEIMQVVPGLSMVQVDKGRGSSAEFYKFYAELTQQLQGLISQNALTLPPAAVAHQAALMTGQQNSRGVGVGLPGRLGGDGQAMKNALDSMHL